MKTKALLFIVLLLPIIALCEPWYYGSGEVVSLENQLGFLKSPQKVITGSFDDPTTTSKTAAAGSLYIRTNGSVYIKKDSGSSTNWKKALDLTDIDSSLSSTASETVPNSWAIKKIVDTVTASLSLKIDTSSIDPSYASTSSTTIPNSWGLKRVWDSLTASIASIPVGPSHNPAGADPLAQNGLSVSATQTISLQNSSSTATGALSATDWSAFNGKQAAGNYLITNGIYGDATVTASTSTSATITLVAANIWSKALGGYSGGLNIYSAVSSPISSSTSALSAFGQLQGQTIQSLYATRLVDAIGKRFFLTSEPSGITESTLPAASTATICIASESATTTQDQMDESKTATGTTSVANTATTTGAALIKSWLTPTTFLMPPTIPSGVWKIDLYGYAVSGGTLQAGTSLQSSSYEFCASKRTAAGVETLLFCEDSGRINNQGTTYYEYHVPFQSQQPDFTGFVSSDRLLYRFYARNVSTTGVSVHIWHGGTINHTNSAVPLGWPASVTIPMRAQNSLLPSGKLWVGGADGTATITRDSFNTTNVPNNRDVLTWDTTTQSYIPAPNVQAVGGVSSLYLSTTATVADNFVLSTSPTDLVETSTSTAVTLATSPKFLERFVSAPLGLTTIPSGIWSFTTYASSSAVGTGSLIKVRINKRVPQPGGAWGMFSGSGPTRTFSTTGSGFAPFTATMADPSVLMSSLIETPTQTGWISGFTSSATVTVTLSDPTFVNPTATVTLGAIYEHLFHVESATITSSSQELLEISSTQPAFTLTGTGTNQSLVAAFFATTNNATSRNITLYWGGSDHYTRITTPVSVIHNQLIGLQGCVGSTECYHMSAAQYSALHSPASVDPANGNGLSVSGGQTLSMALGSTTATGTVKTVDTATGSSTVLVASQKALDDLIQTQLAINQVLNELDLGDTSGNKTLVLTNGYSQKMNLTGNATLSFSGDRKGAAYIFRLVQSGGGSKTVSWPVNVRWSGGTAPTLTTTASRTDVVACYASAGTGTGTEELCAATLNYAE